MSAFAGCFHHPRGLHEGPLEKLDAYAWPGGYPVVYVDERGDCLCASCAAPAKLAGCAIYAGVHWEGESEHCADCGREIESAYGPTVEES